MLLVWLGLMAFYLSYKTIKENQNIKLYDRRLQYIQAIQQHFWQAIEKNQTFLLRVSNRMLYIKYFNKIILMYNILKFYR
jgi:hypothetical protein